MSMHEDDRGVRPPLPGARIHTARERELERAAELVAPAGWRLSWGAVLAGVLVALVAHLTLNLLGIGVGLSGAPRGAGLEWFGTGFAVWWAIAGILSAAIGGWVAGRTLGATDRDDGLIHGILTWAGTTLVIAFLLATAMGSTIGMQEHAQIMYGQHVATGAGGAPGTAATTPPAAVPAPGAPARPTTGAMSGAAIASFVALLLGAAAAGAAGRAGVSAARRSLREDV